MNSLCVLAPLSPTPLECHQEGWEVVRSPIPWNERTQVSPEMQPDLHGPLGK